MTTTQPRKCFYIPIDQRDVQGFIPSLVTEDEPGHSPLTGNGPGSAPWHWGQTYEEAQAIAVEENASMGISPQDAVDIVMSSMAAQNDGRGRHVDDEIAACTPECDHPDGDTTGHPFPGRPGYLTGECGHAVAENEWRAGFRECERC